MRVLLIFIALFTCFFATAQYDEKIEKKAIKWRGEMFEKYEKGDISVVPALNDYYNEGLYKGKAYNFLRIESRGREFAEIGARQGCASCMYWQGRYALMPITVIGEKEDYPAAISHFTKAADLGYIPAIIALARLYEARPDLETKQSNARGWYTKGALARDSLSVAKVYSYNIADNDPVQKGLDAYKNGDFAKALEVWQIAFDLTKSSAAAYNLATLYQNGKGVPVDLNRAATYYALAGERGDKEGYYWSAELHLYLGDKVKAYHLYESAQKLGYPGLAAKMEAIRPDVEKQEAAWAKQAADDKARWAREDEAREQQRLRQNASAAEQQRRFEQNEARGTTNYSGSSSSERYKTCPICNGTGKKTGSYTTERRDPKTNAIILTDHSTTGNCSRCNGSGKISY